MSWRLDPDERRRQRKLRRAKRPPAHLSGYAEAAWWWDKCAAHARMAEVGLGIALVGSVGTAIAAAIAAVFT